MCNNSLEIGLDFEDRMNELATQFAQAADGAPYVVYAILDSTKTDPRSRYQALPFYVGETKNPHGRAIDHIRRALAQRDKYQSARSEIYHLILANQLPRFIVLERCSTRAQSLEAEAGALIAELERRGFLEPEAKALKASRRSACSSAVLRDAASKRVMSLIVTSCWLSGGPEPFRAFRPSHTSSMAQ